MSRPTPPRRPAWTPEREITVAIAQRLLRAQFAELTEADLQFFAQGWDNTAVRVSASGDEYPLIFRFPRRAIALPGIRREQAWLPLLAPLLPLAVPVPRFRGVWELGEQSWPFWGGRLLPGTELAMTAPDEGPRRRLAGELGRFLRVLHQLAPGGFAAGVGLEIDPLGRADPSRHTASTTDCLSRLVDSGLDVPLEAALAVLTRAARLPAPAGESVICHGDLHARHVLVDGCAAGGSPLRATGVIDWGDLCLADPAVDLSIAFGAFSGEQRDAFFAAYGPIDGERELRARALAIRLNALLAEYAFAERNEGGPGAALLPEVSTGITRAIS